MGAVSTPPPPDRITPQHCPTRRELDDLELLTGGAFAPVWGFNEPGSPITLDIPVEVADRADLAGAIELVDPEGLPLARVAWPTGEVEPLAAGAYGPFRTLHLTPAAVRREHPGRTVVPVTDALTTTELDELRGLGPVLLLAFTGVGTPNLSPVALVRATLAAADLIDDAVVVAVPLALHGDPDLDHQLGVTVATHYAGAGRLHALSGPAARVDRSLRTEDSGDIDLSRYPDPIADIIAFDQPEPAERGLVLFFTGLSGSGKSTLARALTDLLLEQGARTVTSLDGDVVRRQLSAGLSFSREDRETNIRRIGWVAAEIARHGGVAVVSPIAPFDETRQQVREMVDAAGGAFFLIHVATPLEECERRDRKGLYAKARRGEIPEFTGISSPYDEPHDADVRVDTTGRTIDDALSEVLVALRDEGYLDLTPTSVAPTAAAALPLKVLFVCTANICRSPSMELLSRELIPGGALMVSSAGTHGFDREPINPELAAALDHHRPGIDTSGFGSRRLTAAMLTEADLVLTAEASHREWILGDHPALFRKVFSLGQFAAAIDRAPTDLDPRELLAHVGAQRGPADPAFDVPDPYRRGPQAAADAVSQIARLLRVVLPALVGSGRLSR